ncbi:MAG: CapA family protein [Chloroflexota bacterium]
MTANRGLIAAGIVVALVAVVGGAALLNKPAAPPGPTATSAAVIPTPYIASPSFHIPASPEIVETPAPTRLPRPTETPPRPTETPPQPTETPPQPPLVEMPFVPVVGFWSTRTEISRQELLDAARGTSAQFSTFLVPTGDEASIADMLAQGMTFQTGTVAEIELAVKQDGVLGILRATDVSQRVRALAVDGVSVFGNHRVVDVDDWPLLGHVVTTEGWDQAALWTLVAAGDVMMDRAATRITLIDGEGGDYLFDGGTARITGMRCCSSWRGDLLPIRERTGNRGLVRELLTRADLAISNLETAVLVDAPYHRGGFTLTADVTLLDAVDRAGLDFMSVGNNHIRDAYEHGLLTAIRELDARGIAHSGAGLGPDAGDPGYLDANGVRIAVISCEDIVPEWVADRNTVGTFNCSLSDVAGRVRKVRPTADLVIVFPHWGRQYRPVPVSYERELAADWVSAGADMVIGMHSHVAGAIEDIDGRVVFYSLGNFVFDMEYRQSTVMGVVPEMTFSGTELIQIELHATLLVDTQPNLVAPEDGGDFVFDQMREASEGLLDY